MLYYFYLWLLITKNNKASMNYRQKLILDKLNHTEVVTIAALAQELAVSKMTIHRDLAALQQAGLILKQHGKVSATAKLSGYDPTLCSICGQKIKERNTFTIIDTEGRKYHFCCPHCGLLAYSRQANNWQILATDFIHGHVMTASQAHFLIDPDLTICCSPSFLAFSSPEEALKFQKGFGGRIVNLHLAVEFLTQSTLKRA